MAEEDQNEPFVTRLNTSYVCVRCNDNLVQHPFVIGVVISEVTYYIAARLDEHCSCMIKWPKPLNYASEDEAEAFAAIVKHVRKDNFKLYCQAFQLFHPVEHRIYSMNDVSARAVLH